MDPNQPLAPEQQPPPAAPQQTPAVPQPIPQQPVISAAPQPLFAPIPTPVQVQPGANPYEFITNPAAAKKAPLIAAGSFRGRLLLVGGIGALLIIVVIVGASLLGGNGAGNAVTLQGLLAEQQEILRISKYGITEGRDANTLNLAMTAQQSVATDQLKLDTYLTSKKVKTTPVQLAAKKDASTDEKLKEAQDNNNFDAAFETTILAMLNTYKANASAAYKDASTPASKTILEESYNSADTLTKFYDQAGAN